jgi:hypothetical protein
LEIVEIDGVVFVEVAATAIKAEPSIEAKEPVEVGTWTDRERSPPILRSVLNHPVVSNVVECAKGGINGWISLAAEERNVVGHDYGFCYFYAIFGISGATLYGFKSE